MSAPFNEFGPFAVGEVCRVVRSDYRPELIGTEVEITSPLSLRKNSLRGESWMGYGTNVLRFTPREEYLRRIRPPATDSHERTFMAEIHKLADKAPQRQGETA